MGTEIRFTGKVDHRFAWLGNDAQGEIDLEAELVAFINSATSSVAVSTMTFSLGAVGDALAAAANAGRKVRVVGNAGHRFQQGWFRAQRAAAQVVDNNLPALVHRISFQQAGAVPDGFLVDSGAAFGDRGGGLRYGWSQDVSGDINAHSAPAAFTSRLLGHCYAKRNDTQRTWSIELPSGYYYVVAVTGEANYGSKSFVLAQGQTIFTYKDSSGLHYSDHTDSAAGEFGCSVADGGEDSTSHEPAGRRLDVSSGTLTLTVGQGVAGATTWTGLNYIEIYRGSSSSPLGDPNTDRTLVQERQLHHSKFILLDAETASPRLWTGSHNLTPIDLADPRSEDALVTDDAAICAVFAAEFDQWWGTSALVPDPVNARHGRFKVPKGDSGMLASTLLGASFRWEVHFSPSVSTAPGENLYQVVADHLNGATNDVVLGMEQFTDSGDFGGFRGTSYLMSHVLDPLVGSGVNLLGVLSGGDSILTRYAGNPDVVLAVSDHIHDKFALVDAVRDTRQLRIGKLLMGSMNWSQSAMHVNDEQTLVIEDPALANQVLQRAMAALDESGILPVQPVDMVIVVDRSYSMTDPATAASTKMAAARAAADLFVDLLEHDGSHRVALVRFGVSVEPFTPSSTLRALDAAYLSTLHAQIATIDATLPIGNATCYGLPLLEAQSLLTSVATPNPRRVVVFLTDGRENHAPYATGIYEPFVNGTGVELHTTAFGPFDPFAAGGANAILNDMATYSGGTFAQVDDDAIHLQKRFAEIARDAMGMITIVDPTFHLEPGARQTLEVPVDLERGVVKFVAVWGGAQERACAMSLRTPQGVTLTTRSPGVTRLLGQGREIWRVDLEKLLVGCKGSVSGAWTVTVAASRDQIGLARSPRRVDLAVYASRSGVDLRVELDERGDQVGVLMRASGPTGPVKEVAYVVEVEPPVLSKRREVLRLEAMRPALRDPRWRGVRVAELKTQEPGAHMVRVVARGVDAEGRAFRREITTSFLRGHVALK